MGKTLGDYAHLTRREIEQMAREGDEDAARLLSFFTAVEPMMKRLGEHLAEGTFMGDVLRALHGNLDAAGRLTMKYLSRCAVFHPQRWSLLRARFVDYADGRREDVAWQELATQSLYLLLKTQEMLDMPLFNDGTYRWLRRELRKEIERFLLDGQTLDAMREEPLPEDADVPDLEREVDLELLMLRERLTVLLEGLKSIDLEILLAGYGDDGELAQRLGISIAALRKRRERLKKLLEDVMI